MWKLLESLRSKQELRSERQRERGRVREKKKIEIILRLCVNWNNYENLVYVHLLYIYQLVAKHFSFKSCLKACKKKQMIEREKETEKKRETERDRDIEKRVQSIKLISLCIRWKHSLTFGCFHFNLFVGCKHFLYITFKLFESLTIDKKALKKKRERVKKSWVKLVLFAFALYLFI